MAAEAISEERVFKAYDPAQAKAYAAARGSYHARLIEKIIDHHKSTGGAFGTLVDVGCGPGNATRPLAKYFDVAYGIDPSPGMINAAKTIGAEIEGGETFKGHRIDFNVGRAEDIGLVGDAGRKVDLLISAMAVRVGERENRAIDR